MITLLFFITGSLITEVICNESLNITNITSDTIVNRTKTNIQSTTQSPVLTTIAVETFPSLDHLVPAEESNTESKDTIRSNDGNEKITAKRTIDSRFTGPIVVGDDVKLFTPSDELIRKQINVQIIEPDGHNNGQFLKQTVYVKTENNTVFSSKTTTTTTTTTERPSRRKNIVIEQRSREISGPFQNGVRLANAKQIQNDEDCDNPTERPNVVVQQNVRGKKVFENIDIQQNTKIKKVSYQEESKQNLPFGTRFTTTTKSPCEQPCSTPIPKLYRPAIQVTSRLKSITTAPPYLPPRIVTTTHTPAIITTPSNLITSTFTPVQVKTVVVPRPIVHHTHSVGPTVFVEKPVVKVVKEYVPRPYPKPTIVEKPVYIHTHTESPPKIVKEVIKIPQPVVSERIVPVEKLVPVDRIVEKEKIVHVPQVIESQQIQPVEVEKLVVQEVRIPFERHFHHPVEKLVPYYVPSKPVEIEKVVTKEVPVHVSFWRKKVSMNKLLLFFLSINYYFQVNHVIEKIVDRPVVQEKIVEKIVDRPVVQVVEKFIDRPIQVGIPVHVPYYLPIEIPVHVPQPIHIPYLLKPEPPKHFIIKTTKYGKGHGLFDWKHSHQKNIKHIIFKKPFISDELIASPTIDSIGLLPPSRLAFGIRI